MDEESTPTPTTKKPYREKKSQKQHEEKKREAMGNKAMTANSTRLDNILFYNLSSITTRLQSFKNEPQKMEATLSQTTRGIGFNSLIASNMAVN